MRKQEQMMTLDRNNSIYSEQQVQQLLKKIFQRQVYLVGLQQVADVVVQVSRVLHSYIAVLIFDP